MILNFQLTNVESKVYSTADDIRKYKNININYDVNLKNPSLVVQNTPFGEKSVLRIEYTFAINYLSPNIGHIRFEGMTDYYSDEDLKALKEKWDSGKAPGDIQNELANTMVANLAPLALLLSKSLGLPPSMPIPVINFQQQAQKKKEEPTFYHG
ncbi:MAG: hypothetical protein MPEBLZ_00142 [Candidatus Methanoperedens nitroreducens]|uniref:Uncharacterized protein n=1 Tax=Candidatus Methanoperedens nitratireducens TaxID=1392998 RepID=A0A0P8CDZ3_9EURY|nr:hypothetical protein [Candidatus Methanoperedens sp. BLZ2]KAB2946287.1 MAG: hypothetical protein F9K14_08125 [Candidatus Methanoperedens sp.]KPQ45261.1 MAG: hypothetical protein MPEBLZ_00142 [Candidatus Methanoperedens sp. BLZ1]MBZ0176041.1 hypothetical protein [Candidatus Methanoperedens nitroreducens]CAG0999994.1 hypothetical protein METP2_03189 [Methanosarcinales archaeon]MCX9076769.1 hypothetical protein [Candidatus Methanoperedens sp.]